MAGRQVIAPFENPVSVPLEALLGTSNPPVVQAYVYKDGNRLTGEKLEEYLKEQKVAKKGPNQSIGDYLKQSSDYWTVSLDGWLCVVYA